LKEDVLRKYALERSLNTREKYQDKANLRLPDSPYIKSFFNSLKPYLEDPKNIKDPLSILKVKEAVELLMRLNFDLTDFLFDFSEPHKVDLEAFMVQNFKFNVPIEKFAKLTGRSLASFKRDFNKTFNSPPRQWLQLTRLTEAHFQIEKNKKKPSSIYLELGFESLSHFHYAFKKQFGYTPKDISNPQKP
jgi:AraC-like DNA-binding protein